MNYTIGCAFSLDDVIYKVPTNKMHFKGKDCIPIVGRNNKKVLIKYIFCSSLRLVLEDIIENHVTFWLPVWGYSRCCLRMDTIRGDKFKWLRQHGKWKDVDILKSDFSGSLIKLIIYNREIPKDKVVYVGAALRDRIIERINEGAYQGASIKDTKIDDYYELLLALYPSILARDIKKILSICWRSVYLLNSFGGDVVVNNKMVCCYMGYLIGKVERAAPYYIKKLLIRIRVLYKRKQIPYDGYYYFALSEKLYLKYLELKNDPNKKYVTLTNIYLFRILDECKLSQGGSTRIFRIPYPMQLNGYKLFFPEYVTNEEELIITRKTLTFKDTLTTYNKYDTIHEKRLHH